MIFRETVWRSPHAAFAPLAGLSGAHLLHGGERGDSDWSILVAFPTRMLTLEDGNAAAWLDKLADMLAARRPSDDGASPENAAPAPFMSGLVGYVGYEALASLEPTLKLPESPYALPAARFGVYDAAALFHREKKKAYIAARDPAAADRLEAALGAAEPEPERLPAFSAPQSNCTRAEYEAAVAEVIERIRNGDFFQANIAQTLTAKASGPFAAFDLFRAIASTSNAFFAACLQYDEGAVVSNSPERFFKLDGRGRLEAEPIKGTRPRGADEDEDRALADALLRNQKDRAENIMIADLMRNDLSRVCADHSIREEAICELMTLTQAHHLVSRISGALREGVGVGAVFRALFPSGSITGAPKIEAMKAISEIERKGRGPYCGAIGYIDDRGLADFSVAIRTMMVDQAGARLSIPVGGGVTLLSDPAAEYEETLVKARAALAAIGQTAEALR